jgi:hypothetical protein
VIALKDYALNPLRDALMPIGTVSPSKFAHWKAEYAPALKAIDEASPGFLKSVDNAAKATDAMIEAGRQRNEALDSFEKSAAGQFIAKSRSDPTEVENHVGSILSDRAEGPTRMAELVKAASADPRAVAGLKKAGVDWMLRRFSTTAEAGTSGETSLASAAFQKFVSENRSAIKALYESDGLGNFAGVAHDLQQANRPITATRVAGSPGTAHDIAPMLSEKAKSVAAHTSLMVALIEGTKLGYEHGGLKGAGVAMSAAAVSYLLGTMRAAGIRTKNDLVRDALLNPERARLYISSLPRNNADSRAFAAARAIRRQLILGPELQSSQTSDQGQAMTPATDRTVPESQATLDAQTKQLVSGRRPMVLFKGGVGFGPVPPGMQQARIGNDVAVFNPKQISRPEIEKAVDDDTIGKILGLGSYSKNDIAARVATGERPLAVTERAADGTELRAAAGTDKTAANQATEMAATKQSGSTIQKENPAAVIAGRLSPSSKMTGMVRKGLISEQHAAKRAMGHMPRSGY